MSKNNSAISNQAYSWRIAGAMALLIALVTTAALAEDALAAEPPSKVDPYAEYYGSYRMGSSQMIGIDRFITDSGEHALLFSDYSSGIEQMRWAWTHVLNFSPLPELNKLTCPVLALWGALDESTEATEAARNMRKVLTEAGHKDFTLRIFPNANHPLMEMPSGSRMAPGVFETLRSWLLERVHASG